MSHEARLKSYSRTDFLFERVDNGLSAIRQYFGNDGIRIADDDMQQFPNDKSSPSPLALHSVVFPHPQSSV